jgi:hypothetical protein
MPPHASHLLQPLDVGCFAVLKRFYGTEVAEYIRLKKRVGGRSKRSLGSLLCR